MCVCIFLHSYIVISYLSDPYFIESHTWYRETQQLLFKQVHLANMQWLLGKWNKAVNYYTPGIYAEGYIVFVFPFIRSYVHSFFCSFVCTSFRRMEFASKFLKWCISQQLLIRKHTYLDHSYPGGLAVTPWSWTPGSMPRGGAIGQNLGHL